MVNLGKSSLSVLENLRAALDRGDYPVGRKLPSERALAEEFGVSRPTIRRAVVHLVEEGRIRTRHGSGMFPNGPALAAGRSATISVMCEYDGEILSHLQSFLLRRGFMLSAFSVTARHFDPEVERLFLERVRIEKPHALLAFCSPLHPSNTDSLDALAAAGIRVVHIEPFRINLPDQEYFLPDYELAGRMAAKRLRDLKCSTSIYVRMNQAPYEMLLERGFRKIATDAKVFIVPPGVENFPPSRREVTAFLEKLPTRSGLFCRSLDIARGIHEIAMQHASGKNLQILGMSADTAISELPFDIVAFDRKAQIEQALAHVARPDFPVIRQFIIPTFISTPPNQ